MAGPNPPIRTQRHTIFLLALCEALTRTSTIVVLATMALTGRALAPHPGLATLPLALVPITTMLTTVPAAHWMQRRGRRAGFALGAALGALGGFICAVAVIKQLFFLLCLGALFLGMVNGFATYYRFAAAEVAAPDYRSRAISLVMGGGVIAAFTGSNLANWSSGWIDQALFAGSFFSLAAVHLLVIGVLRLAALPQPQNEAQTQPSRSLATLALQPNFILALVGAVCSYGVMSLLMNATPLSMQRHHHPFADTTWVIQWHVLGMYVPSFFTGHLIGRFGETRIMLAGVLVILTAVAVNTGGVELMYYWAGLTLLGLGWNFLFVGATSLLTTTYEPWEKAKVQSTNDFLVFGAMALVTGLAAPLEAHFGWSALNQATVPVLLLVGLGIAWLHVRQRMGQT
ncbi:MAG: MFS transporter [Candidatus Latescibacteria bacterium]|nr:MFS transporter [Candidatus Latescibacterota bacterium]